MKQKLRVFLTLLLCAVASVGWGQTTYKLEQVTSVEEGSLYVFEQSGYVMTTVSNKVLQTTNSYKQNKLVGNENYVFTLETGSANNKDGFKMKNMSLSSNPYIANTSSTNISAVASSGASIWTFGFQDDQTVLIQNNSFGDRFLGFQGENQFGYKAYATDNLDLHPHAIKVYKLVEETGTEDPVDPNINISPLSIAIDGTASGAYPEELTDFAVSSSNNSVATATAANGVITVTGVAEGNATIKATWSATDNYTAGPKTFEIAVTKITPTVTFESASATILVGGTFTNTLTDNTNDALTYQYSSEDNTIAEVSSTGVVTGKKVGTATITAEWDATNRYAAGSASYQITVATAGSDAFELVTDASDLAAGDEIIIVNAENSHAISTTQNTNNRKATSVTVSADETITPSSEVEVITLEGQSDAWNFGVTGGYLYAASSTSNNLKTESLVDENGNANAAITISDGIATVVFQGTNTRNTLRYNPNNNNPMFSCYAENTTTGTAVRIYKKPSTSQKADAGLEFSEETVNVNVGETTTVTFTKETTATVNVVNSDESVATYNIETGLVTALKVGTTTITATSQANDDYKAGNATFTITVVDPNALEAMFNFDDDYATLFPTLPGVSSGSGDSYVSEGDINENLTATVDGVALTVSAGVPVEGSEYFTPNRIWASSPRLRMYSGTLTITAPADYEITGLEINQGKWNDGNSANVGTLTSTGWTGNAHSVTISIAGNTQFKSINVMITKIEVVTFDEQANNASDFAAVYNANVGENKNVQMLREFGYDYWNTFVVPFNLTRAQLEEAFGEGVQVAKYTGFDKPANIKFETVDGDVTRADLMIVKPAATVTNPIFKGVTLEEGKAYNYPSGVKNYSDTNFAINGRFAKQVLTDSDEFGKVYFLNKQGLFTHPTSTGNVIRGFRWFIQLKTPESSTGAKITLDVDGDVTSIDAIDNGQFATDAIYNLSGQRVQKAQKGIYIVNGKKVVVK